MIDREKVISKLEKEVQRTYSTKTTVFQNGEKVSEEINTHREPCVRIPIEMADKILALLKEKEPVKPKRMNHSERASFDNYLCECKTELYYKQKFCDDCGRPVKWD